MSENKLIAVLTDVMRDADKAFEVSGGGTRHYIRDCLLPRLVEAGVKIQLPPFPDMPIWVPIKELSKNITGEVIAKTNYKRNILAFVEDNGHVDWRNAKHEDERIEFILDESPAPIPDTRGGLRWVKASERWPDPKTRVFYRIQYADGCSAWGDGHLFQESNRWREEGLYLEWLDESPQPKEPASQEGEKALPVEEVPGWEEGYDSIACDHKLPNGFSAWHIYSMSTGNGPDFAHDVHTSVCSKCGDIRRAGYRMEGQKVDHFDEQFDVNHPDAVFAIVKQCNYMCREVEGYDPFVRLSSKNHELSTLRTQLADAQVDRDLWEGKFNQQQEEIISLAEQLNKSENKSQQ